MMNTFNNDLSVLIIKYLTFEIDETKLNGLVDV